MAYGGIYGGEVNLAFAGAYTPPSGDAVNLVFIPVEYTFSIVGKSTPALYGVGLQVRFADYDIATWTNWNLETPYREFQISSGASLYVETPLRSPEISLGSTTPVLYAGFIANVTSGSTTTIDGYASIRATYDISSFSYTDVALIGIANTVTYVSSKSRVYGEGRFNKNMTFSSYGSSTISIAPMFVANVSGLSEGASSISALVRELQQRAATSDTATTTSISARSLFNAATTVPASSDVACVSVLSYGGAVVSDGVSVCSFVSDYIAGTPSVFLMDVDTAFVRTGTSSVYVLN